MIVVAAAIGALFVCVLILARAVDRDRREHARERQLLLNQLLHATGNTWQPPPAEPPAPRETRPVEQWVSSPEQFPLD